MQSKNASKKYLNRPDKSPTSLLTRIKIARSLFTKDLEKELSRSCFGESASQHLGNFSLILTTLISVFSLVSHWQHRYGCVFPPPGPDECTTHQLCVEQSAPCCVHLITVKLMSQCCP